MLTRKTRRLPLPLVLLLLLLMARSAPASTDPSLAARIDEIVQAEARREIQELLKQAEALRQSVVRTKSPQVEEEESAAERRKRSSSTSFWKELRSVESEEDFVHWITESIRSRRPAVRKHPRFVLLRRSIGVGLWELLGFCRLYRFREAILENLGFRNGATSDAFRSETFHHEQEFRMFVRPIELGPEPHDEELPGR